MTSKTYTACETFEECAQLRHGLLQIVIVRELRMCVLPIKPQSELVHFQAKQRTYLCRQQSGHG